MEAPTVLAMEETTQARPAADAETLKRALSILGRDRLEALERGDRLLQSNCEMTESLRALKAYFEANEKATALDAQQGSAQNVESLERLWQKIGEAEDAREAAKARYLDSVIPGWAP